MFDGAVEIGSLYEWLGQSNEDVEEDEEEDEDGEEEAKGPGLGLDFGLELRYKWKLRECLVWWFDAKRYLEMASSVRRQTSSVRRQIQPLGCMILGGGRILASGGWAFKLSRVESSLWIMQGQVGTSRIRD